MAAKDHVRGGQDADGMRLREPSASVRLRDGTVSERPLRQVTVGQVVTAGPWRVARSARGQAHYPGYYWSATSGGHVIYESRLELARLLLADFDPEVTAIAAQPFLLRAQVSGGLRRHVPDFLLGRADQTAQVVNVKPAARLDDPAVAEALAWPGALFEGRGWDHEIWTGAAPVLLANVRFLAGYRRPGMPPDEVTSAVLGEARPGERLGGLLDRLERSWPRPAAKAGFAIAATSSPMATKIRPMLSGTAPLTIPRRVDSRTGIARRRSSIPLACRGSRQSQAACHSPAPPMIASTTAAAIPNAGTVRTFFA